MSLCPTCRSVNVPNLTCKLDDLPPWWNQVSSKSSPRGMVHLADARNLPASASAGCPLCGLILNAVLQNINSTSSLSSSIQSPDRNSKRTIHDLERELSDQPIYLRTNYDPFKPSFPEDGAEGAWHIRGLKAFVPVDHGVLTGSIRLFAAGDSPAGARCDIIGRHELHASDSPEAFELIQRWMNTCCAEHDACRETLAGSMIDEATPPILPTRIIHVGRPNEALLPRLHETQGKRGHYVALSHCWGPLAHRPLMTTQSTIDDHIAGIPWDLLPRTYQDAISATHRLGFEYIWIDSLCIVQDSHADWLGESKRMGDVYQHARLTIAASHAADSSQPCFFPRAPLPPTVELPHISASGEAEGSIFASLLPPDYDAISPDFGALAYRAWASQEWILSRRMIFYTAGNLVWSCKVISQRETGASFHAATRNTRWKNFVEKYSARLLTQQTDRLIAIEGIRLELGRKRPLDMYCLGLWKNSMPDQLLWYCREPAERGKSTLDLPTWTWASTLHGVRFLDIKGAKNACGGFRFDDATGRLSIRGLLRRVGGVSPLGEDAVPAWVAEETPHDIIPAAMSFALHADNKSIIGWGALDEGALIDTQIYYLQLMSKTTKSITGEDIKKTCTDLVLLLRHRHKDAGEYERVGVGIIRTSIPWFIGVESVDVRVR